jgi:hypothetical protein
MHEARHNPFPSCRERQSLTPTFVGPAIPVIPIFDGCFFLREGVGKGRGERMARNPYNVSDATVFKSFLTSFLDEFVRRT